MNNRIFPNFNEDFEPESEDKICPICDLVETYLHEITYADDHEELESLLHGLVEDAFQDGYISALQDDVEVKSSILDEIY